MAVILATIITIVCVVIAIFVFKEPNKVYVQRWTCKETGVSYLITNTSIIEMRNLDGTYYIEGGNKNENN